MTVDVGKYGKAIGAAVSSGLVAFQGILLANNGRPITIAEWITVALAVLAPGGLTYVIHNSGTVAAPVDAGPGPAPVHAAMPYVQPPAPAPAPVPVEPPA